MTCYFQTPKPLTFSRASVLKLPVQRVYERIVIAPELASTLTPREVKPDSAVAMLTGSLENHDNQYTLKVRIRTSSGISIGRGCRLF